MPNSENSCNSTHLLAYANSKKAHHFESVFSEETVLLFDSKDSVVQNLLVWGSCTHSEIQPNFLSLKMPHWERKKKKDADQLMNTFYSFHLALSHLAKYSYVIICIQLVDWLSQGSTVCAVSARLSTLRFRVLDSGFIWAPLPVQSAGFQMSKLRHVAEHPVRAFMDVRIENLLGLLVTRCWT